MTLVVIIGSYIGASLSPLWSILPNSDDLIEYATVLWQVHAALLAAVAIVVTVAVTVVVNKRDSGRTWRMYLAYSWFFPIITINFAVILSEGIASLILQPASTDSNINASVPNIIVPDTTLFFACAISAIVLFGRTIKFVDPDFVDKLSEDMINRGIHTETIMEYDKLETLKRELRSNG
ncbi:MAG: hypothetical protein HQ553_04560 [Chloroflexi bacterium]|nr:hypothetical protein [Chloroflexota bacterium]